jgi:predicted nucleic acid-binding protein
MLRLPYRFVVPLPIRQVEALDLAKQDWRRLDDLGLVTFDLPPERVADALRLRRLHPKLSANDCFCLVSTQCHGGGMLLTGDHLLREVATQAGVRVHGVLWVVDELHRRGACSESRLIAVLECWRDDRAVFLPRQEIDRRLRRLRGQGHDRN